MGPTECKFDKVTAASTRKAEFKRSYYDNATKLPPLYLQGKFVNHRHLFQPAELDAMDVVKRNGAVYSFERLFQAFEHYTCGVFFVSKATNKGGNNYELRTKDGVTPHSRCREKFESYLSRAGGKKAVLCKHIK